MDKDNMSRVELTERWINMLGEIPLYGDLSLTRDETIHKIAYLLEGILINLAIIADALTEDKKEEK